MGGAKQNLNQSNHNSGDCGAAARVYWRVEGSLLELTTVRPIAFFTWNGIGRVVAIGWSEQLIQGGVEPLRHGGIQLRRTGAKASSPEQVRDPCAFIIGRARRSSTIEVPYRCDCTSHWECGKRRQFGRACKAGSRVAVRHRSISV